MGKKHIYYLIAGIVGGAEIIIAPIIAMYPLQQVIFRFTHDVGVFLILYTLTFFLWGALGGAISALVYWLLARGKYQISVASGFASGALAGVTAFLFSVIIGVIIYSLIVTKPVEAPSLSAWGLLFLWLQALIWTLFSTAGGTVTGAIIEELA